MFFKCRIQWFTSYFQCSRVNNFVQVIAIVTKHHSCLVWDEQHFHLIFLLLKNGFFSLYQPKQYLPRTDRLLKHTAKQDTVELPLLGFGAHAAELLLVAAQAPGVVADLFWAQAAVAIQHLEGYIRVDLQVQAWTLQLLYTDDTHTHTQRGVWNMVIHSTSLL